MWGKGDPAGFTDVLALFMFSRGSGDTRCSQHIGFAETK